MREKIRDKNRIEHIIQSIERINMFIKDIDKESFFKDPKTYYAVVKNLEMIGEAAYMVTDELKANNAEIPWAKIKGMRNVLVHEYFNVSYEQVWSTLTADLNPLLEQMKSIYQTL